MSIILHDKERILIEMDINDFPSPHTPSKLPIETIIQEIITDQTFLKLSFSAVSNLSGFMGYLQNLPNPEILISSLTLQESVLSSKIEGTIATLSDVVEDSPTSETIKNDIVEIKNYVEAVKFGHEELHDRNFQFSSYLIRTLHSILLTNNVRGANKCPGKFKTEQNYILNDAIGNFTPLPPILTSEYIDNLVDYINNYEEMTPILQAGIAHVQFEMIHPFQDGNGRIGRLLIPLILYAKELLPFPTFYISRYFSSNEDIYKKYLSEVSKSSTPEALLNAWKNWLIFFFNGIKEESVRHIETSKKIMKLSDEIRGAIKRTDQLEIINYLFDNLWIEPSEFSKTSSLSSSTIYSTLRNLSQMGFITRTGSERKTRYVFTKLVDIL